MKDKKDTKIHIRKMLPDGKVVIPINILRKLNLDIADSVDLKLKGKEVWATKAEEKTQWTRKIGCYSRIVIPKYFRDVLEINAGDLVEIVLKDNTIRIFKARLKCKVCGDKIENSSERVRIFYDSYCVKCAQDGKIEC